MKTKIITSVIVCIAIISFSTPKILSDYDQEVEFPDETLEKVIREKIGKPSGQIYEGNLWGITNLDLEDRFIKNIEGLQYCRNLEKIRLTDNKITDISPLAGLAVLTELKLGGNNISDLSPLADLTSLQNLRITSNNIVDISPLVNLTELSWLLLDDNYLSDISPLANLTNLSIVSLHYNAIRDITPLKQLTKIGDMNLQYTGIEYHLDLGGNFIEDLSPLVENPGIDEGDEVILAYNPLNKKSIEEYIPKLKGRGVTVGWQESNVVETMIPESPTGTTPAEPASPKKDNTPVYLGVVGILAALVLVVYLVRKQYYHRGRN
ncbi:MAG: hypothetical protein U9N35_02675 [Euryarchaeota archaeon]|nr:hypothetical protein [Euryarchaeota archaeon]